MPTLETVPVPAAVVPDAPARAYVAPHIWLDARGRAWIDDTNVKVIEIAQDHVAYGWGVEKMFEEYPGSFTLAQLHAAFAYYHDHEEDFTRRIEESRRRADALAAATVNSPLRQHLRALGKI